MKYLIPLILLFPSLVFAVDDATISEIDSKASNANAKAEGNRGLIGALETEDGILHERIDAVESDLAAIESLPVGATPGDILYWDGSVWQLTPVPPVGAAKPPTLTLIAGVPTWTEAGAGVVYAGTIDYDANPDYVSSVGFEFTAPDEGGGSLAPIVVVAHGYKAHKVSGDRQPEPPLTIEPTIVNETAIRVRIWDATGNEYGGSGWANMAAQINYTVFFDR